MPALPDVHVIITSYKHRSTLPAAIESAKADVALGELLAIYTVVDNDLNGEGIKEYIEESHPDVVYIDAGGNVGYGLGNNIGIARADARHVFILNPDAQVVSTDRSVIKTMIEYLEANPGVGCIGPQLLNADGTVQSSCYRFDLLSIVTKPLQHANLHDRVPKVAELIDRLHMRDFAHNEIRGVDWLMGSALLIPQEIIHRVGGFDPRYKLYLEDCDFCRTLWEHGYRVVYYPKVQIKHGHTRHSAKQRGYVRGFLLNQAARKHGFSWMKYLWKWRGRHRSYSDFK